MYHLNSPFQSPLDTHSYALSLSQRMCFSAGCERLRFQLTHDTLCLLHSALWSFFKIQKFSKFLAEVFPKSYSKGARSFSMECWNVEYRMSVAKSGKVVQGLALSPEDRGFSVHVACVHVCFHTSDHSMSCWLVRGVCHRLSLSRLKAAPAPLRPRWGKKQQMMNGWMVLSCY